MKALAINGSPRAGGNTEILLKKAMRNMRHLGRTIAWLGSAIPAISDATPFPKLAVELH
ncbi:MAG: hypothetical protein P8013_08345 [Candidatus Sulfobium sp.]